MTIVDIVRDITKKTRVNYPNWKPRFRFLVVLKKRGARVLPSLELDFFHYGGRAVREGV